MHDLSQGRPEEALPLPEIEAPKEWPQWGWLDVGVVFLIFAGASLLVTALAIVVAPKTPFFYGLPATEVVKVPLFFVPVQLLGYVIAFLLARIYITLKADEDFWTALQWRMPNAGGVLGNVAAGVALAAVVVLVQAIIPMPKSLPIEEYFRDPLSATLMGVFAVLVAPLVEEIFFRGLLLPVASRTLTRVGGIALVSAVFAVVHAPQLAREIAPVAMIFIVGVAFCLRRLRSESLAAAWLMHLGYNGTLFGIMLWVTRGFTQLDKLR